MTIQNFIGGKYQEALSGQRLKVYDPALGAPYTDEPQSNKADIDAAVLAASKALTSWSQTSRKERSHLLSKVADLIDERAEVLAQAESRDVGKPVWLARKLDIPRASENFRFFAGQILHSEGQAFDMDGKALNYAHRQPVGVCGLISPWNLPLYLLTWKIAPALACGNTVVCKPSEVTPMTAFLLCDILQEAGIPDGVCNMVFGTGPEAGAALVAHPEVPLISFTGGTATGQKVIELSAPHFKKLGLELGGKNANVVFESADLDRAVEASVRASFLNQGEICLCGSRLYVQAGIYDEFVSRLTEKVKALTVGSPQDEATFMGPVVSEAHYQKVKEAIALAKKEGAHLLTGEEPLELSGDLKNGYFIRPHLIENLKDDCSLWTEEIFGPVVTVRRFDSEEEVLGLVNGVRYGLSASVWTTDLSQAHRFAQLVRVGTVWVNTWLQRDLRVPFGGQKASGLGREGGGHSIDFYTELTNICVQF